MKNLLTIALVGCVATMASASLFSDNFDVDSTANWQFNTSVPASTGVDLALDQMWGDADFFFDYATLGIPSAPGSTGGSTRGIKLTANMFNTLGVAALFSGCSVAPLGQSFTGDYELSFDCWQNWNAPGSPAGSGTTQFTFAGLGAPTTQVQFPGGPLTGLGFGTTTDGGSSVDYRMYNAPGAVIPAVGPPAGYSYAAGSHNNTNAYYTTAFPDAPIPAAQLALWPLQTGTSGAGNLSFQWRKWKIKKVGDVVTWTVDSTLLATAKYGTPGSDNIFLAMCDINTGASADTTSPFVLCSVIDNVKVDQLLSSTGNLAVSGYAGDLTTETFTAYFKDGAGTMIGSPITFTTDAAGNYSIVTPQTGTFSVIIRGDSTL
ncbi:MAG: hypothetical protein K8R88_04035, partial [Armatimonadetes bacterium]|nr:hypothetical protein [Armatimonadota bacterium]